MGRSICTVGSVSSHGGVIVSVPQSVGRINGKLIAVIGAVHVCGDPDHGTNTVISGLPFIRLQNIPVCFTGISITGCGAVIITGDPSGRA